jgi:cobalamin biosynthesis protein CobT
MKLVLESMFFILFGITFLFILLLIYHFKNKITALEKNVDTMFEILNNVVGDLSRMRIGGAQPNITAGVNYNSDNEPIAHFSDVSNIPVVDNEEEESEDEEETDISDNEDSEDEEEDDDEDNEDEEEDEDSVENSDDEEEEEEIRKISVVLDEKVDEDAIQVEELEESVTNDVEEISVPELKEVEDISVEKVDTPIQEDSANEDKLDKMQQYKKMHIQNLKKLVVSKGLATSDHVSKLKKADLLGILQEE